MIAEGLALIDKAMRHRRSGPYQIQAAISALHARAAKPEETDWTQIDLLYGALEVMQPSPVVTLEPRGRGLQGARRRSGARNDRAAGAAAVELFPFLRRARRLPDATRPQRRSRLAFDRAIALANTSAEAAHIRMHLDRLQRDAKPRGAKAHDSRSSRKPG